MSDPIDLTCGPLTLVFERSTGFVRYVRYGSTEVLRGIYAAVRDQNWDTVPARLTNLNLNVVEAEFAISFDVQCQSRDVDFTWHGSITGDSTGRLTYGLDGVANATFLRNRIGFCVLHPPEVCKGKPCRIERDDGSIEYGEFPLQISPHQPFKNIRAIAHTIEPGLEAEVRFAGDTFEMEDQRNWTDASYKTYCTPLEIPFPVQVTKGTRVSQSVTSALKGDVSSAAMFTKHDVLPIELTVLPRRTLMPKIGLGAASHDQPLSQRQRDKLLALDLAHLRVDLPLFESEWRSIWTRAVAEAKAIDVPLEVAILLGGNIDQELSTLARICTAEPARVARWLVFGKNHLAVESNVLARVREVVAMLEHEPMVGSGTNAYFTELNRQRPRIQGMDVVAYSITPQVHAFDDASLIETLPMQAETINSARALFDDIPIAVTPVTLRPRFNPNATGPEAQLAPDELPVQVDPRQMSPFAAVWTLGSLKHLAEAGASSVTFYETTGWRGVMETETGSPLPDKFASTPGSEFPLYRVFADVAEFKEGQVRAMRSTDPLSADALLLERGESRRMVIANFKDRTIALAISLPQGVSEVTTRSLNGESRDDLAHRSGELYPHTEVVPITQGRLDVELSPHGLLRLDWKATGNE